MSYKSAVLEKLKELEDKFDYMLEDVTVPRRNSQVISWTIEELREMLEDMED